MMPEYAVHRARLMILRKIVLFQDDPVRFNDVSFSKMSPLFIRNKSAHILPCGGADKPSCFSKTDKVFAFFQISCVTINNPSERIKKAFHALGNCLNHFAVIDIAACENDGLRSAFL